MMEKCETKSAKERRRVGSIFWTFFKFGCFTFGGGWSIVAEIQKEYVEKKHWITDEELIDFTSVGRSVPGLMVGNASVLFGYHTAGIWGALAALIGLAAAVLLLGSGRIAGIAGLVGLPLRDLLQGQAGGWLARLFSRN